MWRTALKVIAYLTATWTLVLQGSGDEAASFCFNMLDEGRRGLVRRDSFVAATNSCAMLALHDPPNALQDTQWAEATAAGTLPSLNLSAKQYQNHALQSNSQASGDTFWPTLHVLRKEFCRTKTAVGSS